MNQWIQRRIDGMNSPVKQIVEEVFVSRIWKDLEKSGLREGVLKLKVEWSNSSQSDYGQKEEKDSEVNDMGIQKGKNRTPKCDGEKLVQVCVCLK